MALKHNKTHITSSKTHETSTRVLPVTHYTSYHPPHNKPHKTLWQTHQPLPPTHLKNTMSIPQSTISQTNKKSRQRNKPYAIRKTYYPPTKPNNAAEQIHINYLQTSVTANNNDPRDPQATHDTWKHYPQLYTTHILLEKTNNNNWTNPKWNLWPNANVCNYRPKKKRNSFNKHEWK